LKDVFENSPVSWRVGKTPVMSIVGVLSLVSTVFMAWVYLKDPLSGLSWHPMHEGGGIFLHSRSFDMFLLNILIFISGLVIYYVARSIQRGRGVELDATFKEIPIE